MMSTATGLVTVCIAGESPEAMIARATDRFEVVRVITWNGFEEALDRSQSTHVLVEGLLDALYDPGIPTRDAARTLGRLKLRLQALAECGVEVVVLCQEPRCDLGTRSHFLSSLCASADRVVTDLLAA